MTLETEAVIFVNGRFLSQPLTGVQRYAEEVLSALDDLPISRQIIVLAPKKLSKEPDWKNIRLRRVGYLSGHAWEQLELPFYAKGLLLNFVSSGPIAKRRQVVSFHDAAIFDRPDLFSRNYVRLHRTLRPILARRARKIVTVSEFSRDRLALALDVATSKFMVIPNGCDHVLRAKPKRSVIAAHGLEVRRYGLCVGTTPNKNISAAIRAFDRAQLPGVKLAVVGASANGVFASSDGCDRPWLVQLGRVDDGELRALYEGAAFFAFPSLYEGFGIPPLEAMRLGCPVIANNSTAIAETVGQAAEVVDAMDELQFASAIQSVFADARRRDLILSGEARASQFTWQAAAEKWVNLIVSESER